MFDKIENYFCGFCGRDKISRSAYKKIIYVVRMLVKHNVPSVADLLRNLYITYGEEKIYFLEGLGCQYYIPVTMKPFPLFVRKISIARITKKYHVKRLKQLKKNLVKQYDNV